MPKKKSNEDAATRATEKLKRLRGEIDAVDSELVRLIGRRSSLVRQVKQAKKVGDLPVHHPGREAQVLDRLLKRYRGAYPPGVVVRIWREIIAASVRLQNDFRVAAPAGAPWALALARSHFGDVTPVAESANPLAAVRAGRASAALLPWPGNGGAGLWWRRFALARPAEVSLIWTLPFVGDGGRQAAVVGRAQGAPSGDDLTWLVLDRALTARDTKGLRRIAQSGRLRLVERDGYISAADASRMAEDLKADAVYWMGSFPRPFGVVDNVEDG